MKNNNLLNEKDLAIVVGGSLLPMSPKVREQIIKNANSQAYIQSIKKQYTGFKPMDIPKDIQINLPSTKPRK